MRNTMGNTVASREEMGSVVFCLVGLIYRGAPKSPQHNLGRHKLYVMSSGRQLSTCSAASPHQAIQHQSRCHKPDEGWAQEQRERERERDVKKTMWEEARVMRTYKLEKK